MKRGDESSFNRILGPPTCGIKRAMSRENQVCRSLRPLLEKHVDGALIRDSEELRDVLLGLEFFLPTVLMEVHKEWRYEEFDGFQIAKARKTGPCAIELIGLCILISDQTLTPFQARLRISSSKDEIEWLECRVGANEEHRPGSMIRIPYNSNRASKLLQRVADAPDELKWTYIVGFGEQQD